MKLLRQWLEVIPLTLTVTGLLAVGIAPAIAQISNTASASADNLDEPVNSNEALLTAAQPRLELTKTADRAAAEPGDTVVYSLAL
ncbi:MAG: hypothetical protein F6K41_35805, partial [Symploca sp. SIO3E6]|nr:hypothetical protein [Caldora sp. SIO3E6]